MYQMPSVVQVNQNISPNDDMNVGDASKWYFDAGKKALDNIVKSLNNPYSDGHRVEQILDLPSGYGRVLRWLEVYFPLSKITACDTNADAVEFSSQHFRAMGVVSDYDIEKIKLPVSNYDLIWCGSLFTHFDMTRFSKLLNLFLDNLNEKGVLVFTSHGRLAAYLMQNQNSFFGLGDDVSSRVLAEYTSSGFGYANYDDKYPVYGVSISSPAWVMKQIECNCDLNVRVCHMVEGGCGLLWKM